MQVRMYPSVDVIVVSYNSEHYLADCLSALLAQDYPGHFSVVVVDNDSCDNSVQLVQSHFPNVRLIRSGGNIGYAAGCNVGVDSSSNETLAFINPDTRAEPEWLRELVEPLLQDPTVGLTTSKIVLMDQPDKVNACGNDVSLSGITTCRHAGVAAETITSNEEVTAVSGASFAISRNLFATLGGFDERFWMYLEDTDLSWRARIAGYRCLLAARSVVAHHYRLSMSPDKTKIIERNRYLMLSKNLSATAAMALIPQFLLSELLTWGWAIGSGPRFAWAKVLALLWVMGNVLELFRPRAHVRSIRRIRDDHVLSNHLAMPPIGLIANGVVARFANFVLLPAAILSASTGLMITRIGAQTYTTFDGTGPEKVEDNERVA